MTEPDTSDLNERQLKALTFFAACITHEDACRQASISRNTFYEWLKEPNFKQALRQLQSSIMEDAMNSLRNCAAKAVERLVHLMEHGSNENVQRMAANDLLKHLQEYKEQEDIIARVEDLKEKVDRMPKQSNFTVRGKAPPLRDD